MHALEDDQRGTTVPPFDEEVEEDVSNLKPKSSANGKRAPA
jgi:hypothetical protein